MKAWQWKLLVSIALGVLFAWLVSRGGVPLLPSTQAFAQMKWWTVPAYVLLLTLTHTLRAVRWRHLLRPIRVLSAREVLPIAWVGFFAIFALPLRLGEFARPSLAKLRFGISMSAGLGTIAVERVVDGLVTSLCVVWALTCIPRLATDDPIARLLPSYGYAAVALFACGFVVLGLFVYKRAFAVRLVSGVLGLVSKRLGEWLATKIAGLADGLQSITRVSLLAAFGLETLAYWGVNALGMWVAAIGCGLDIGFGEAISIMGILALSILLPAGPGLFGNFQLAISKALLLYVGLASVQVEGAAYIFVMYLCQAVFISIAGIVPLYTLNLHFRDLLNPSAMTLIPGPPESDST